MGFIAAVIAFVFFACVLGAVAAAVIRFMAQLFAVAVAFVFGGAVICAAFLLLGSAM